VAPALSIVVTTTQPWPEVLIALDSLQAQARALDAEIVVADGSPDGPPPARHAGVRWLRRPGASVFALRAEALRAARGEVVALTEDHCRVAPDWCAAVLRAHREHPDAAIIGGALENGATGSLIDWANFLIGNGAYLPPLGRGPRADVTGQANVSYKRWALADYPTDALDEGAFRRRLVDAGHPLVIDDRLRVAHVQSLGLAATCALHFHDGRSVVGGRRAWASRRRQWLDVAKAAAFPLPAVVAMLRVVTRAARRDQALRGVALRSAPLVLLILGVRYAGELAGVLAGPGDSPRRLR